MALVVAQTPPAASRQPTAKWRPPRPVRFADLPLELSPTQRLRYITRAAAADTQNAKAQSPHGAIVCSLGSALSDDAQCDRLALSVLTRPVCPWAVPTSQSGRASASSPATSIYLSILLLSICLSIYAAPLYGAGRLFLLARAVAQPYDSRATGDCRRATYDRATAISHPCRARPLKWCRRL